jgi:hypothetical protein
MLVGPAVELSAAQLGPVVHDQHVGVAALAGDVLEHGDHPLPGSEKSTAMAGHSRVQSSFRLAVRNRRPLARQSSVKSSDQRWLAAIGHQEPASTPPSPRFWRPWRRIASFSSW